MVDDCCVLCRSASESRNHLFFDCQYSTQVWDSLARGIMGSAYVSSWPDIMRDMVENRRLGKMKLFCLRYAFQSGVYNVWRERNKVKHGEKLLPVNVLKKLIDKDIRNKLSILKTKKVKGMEEGLQYWFSTRV